MARGDNVKHIVEAALLASGKPLSIDRLLTLFLDDEQPDRKIIRDVLEDLQQEYEGRGIEVREVSTGWRIQVRKEYAPWVSRLWEEKPGRYSRALLETLSLIAYRQPITRGEIEDVRGVAVSTNIVKTLLERDWVRVVGHRDVPGRPSLYATTREFLDYFGLKSLDELPTLAEIKELDDLNPSLDLPEPEAKTDLREAQEEETHADREADSGLPDDTVTESEQEQEAVPDSGMTDDDALLESQEERLH
ncbi:MAG: SMC-Scp complex subunit ScpB [Sedimenticolaceae bacterium]|nr:SMC-Scp complex subunit ScpB [Sedimenticolaceae bacterium]